MQGFFIDEVDSQGILMMPWVQDVHGVNCAVSAHAGSPPSAGTRLSARPLTVADGHRH